MKIQHRIISAIILIVSLGLFVFYYYISPIYILNLEKSSLNVVSDTIASTRENLISDNSNLSNISVNAIQNNVIEITDKVEIEDEEEIPIIIEKQENNKEIEDIVPANSVIVTYTMKDFDRIMYATTSLNVRSKPDATGSVLKKLSLNDEIHVVAKCNETGWCQIEADVPSFISNVYVQNEKIKITNGPFQDFNGSSIENINLANNLWNKKVSDSVREKIINNGYKLYIYHGNLGVYAGYSFSVAGVTYCDSRKILLSDREIAIRGSIAHECGHAIDEIYGYPSETDEFADIFSSECYNFIDYTAIGDRHEISDVNEYFASIMDNIMNNYSNTAASCPRSVEFVSCYMN